MENFTKRSTIIRDIIGCPRASTHILPPEDHVYGYSKPADPTNMKNSLNNRENIPIKENHHNRRQRYDGTSEIVFGMRSEICAYPIKSVVQAEYTSFSCCVGNYPLIPRRRKIVNFPAPKRHFHQRWCDWLESDHSKAFR